jgi:hypothetical protein
MVVYKKDEISVMASNSAKVGSDKVAKSKAPFRYRWQKNGHFEYQDALIKANDADSLEEINKAVLSKKFDATDEDESVSTSNCSDSWNGSPIHPTGM